MGLIKSYPAVVAPNCRALVLGTAPSEASLAAGGHYGHRRNAFWPILFALWGERDPGDYPTRYAFMLAHRVALWDVLESCERDGSLDSAIRGGVPNDIAALLRECPSIRAVFCNGTTAHKLLGKHFPGIRAVRLPSTSPAAAALSFEQKLEQWQALRHAVEEE